jgi:beta-galactosidase
MDMCGFPKDNFYYYQAWWGSRPVLHLFPHWNWEGKEGQEVDVWVHSNLDRVELFLNGQSQGAQDITRNTHLMWKVKYAPGALEARGFKDGKQALVTNRETSGRAAKIVLSTDRQRLQANGEDVAMIAAQILDSQDREVPTADSPLTFKVSGGGKLIGLGNGDPSCHEMDKADSRRAFNGLCMAIVQTSKSADEIHVEASSPGLESATVSLTSVSATLRPSVP